MRTRHFSSSDPVLPSKETHRPVLLHEVLRALDIQPDDVVVDATLGGAGHAKELVKGLGGNGLFIGFDADAAAVERAHSELRDSAAQVHLIHGNFRDLGHELPKRGIRGITKALFDLGWSSYQLNSGRGFSFNADEPLRMTYSDVESALTAAIVVNTWSEASLADVIYGFGGERYARRIAKAIVERRTKKPFATSRELAAVIAAATPAPYRHGRINPATRSFQAIRIAVNDELGALSEGLRVAWELLAPRGRIAVISFHSIEDRAVKHLFAAWVQGGEAKLLSKKPMIASEEEMMLNPRSRSAKLRVIEKIPHESQNTKNKQIRSLNFSGEA